MPEYMDCRAGERPQIDINDRLGVEAEVFYDNIQRWLDQGLEGQFVVIKNREVLGFFPTHERAREFTLTDYLMQDILIKQILGKEPLLRIRGLSWPCLCRPSPIDSPSES